MTNNPQNPPAFPRIDGLNQGGMLTDVIVTGGMSLRDYFAGQALARCAALTGKVSPGGQVSLWNAEDTAKRCYALADAMLEEMQKCK